MSPSRLESVARSLYVSDSAALYLINIHVLSVPSRLARRGNGGRPAEQVARTALVSSARLRPSDPGQALDTADDVIDALPPFLPPHSHSRIVFSALKRNRLIG